MLLEIEVSTTVYSENDTPYLVPSLAAITRFSPFKI
jgi:hypothetical protein